MPSPIIGNEPTIKRQVRSSQVPGSSRTPPITVATIPSKIRLSSAKISAPMTYARVATKGGGRPVSVRPS